MEVDEQQKGREADQARRRDAHDVKLARTVSLLLFRLGRVEIDGKGRREGQCLSLSLPRVACHDARAPVARWIALSSRARSVGPSKGLVT